MRKRMNVVNTLMAVVCTATLTFTACGGQQEASQTDAAQETEAGNPAETGESADNAEEKEAAESADTAEVKEATEAAQEAETADTAEVKEATEAAEAETTESAGETQEEAAQDAESAEPAQEAEQAAAEAGEAAAIEEGAETEESGEAVESPAPAYYEVLSSFTAEDLDGNPVTEEIFAGSKLTMVNVWGTFCGPCIREMPYLGTIAKSYDPSEFQIVGLVSDAIGWDGQVDAGIASTAKDIISQTGADYLHLAPTGELMNLLYELQYVPTTVFVDSEGNAISEEYVGSYSEEDWKAIIEEMLKH